MKFKDFIKPTTAKIIITLILIIITYMVAYPFTICIPGPCFNGVPLGFYHPSGGGVDFSYGMKINYWNLLIDLLFWYLVACAIIFMYNKKQNNLRSK